MGIFIKIFNEAQCVTVLIGFGFWEYLIELEFCLITLLNAIKHGFLPKFTFMDMEFEDL